MNKQIDQWLSPPRRISIDPDEVHLWRLPLDQEARTQPTGHSVELFHTLSTAEAERAENFYFQRDRRRYIVRRGNLRRILSHYLGKSPESIQFQRDFGGKPLLAGSREGHGLQFSISHSCELALIAVAKDRRVGIDIEKINRRVRIKEITDYFFTEEEIDYIYNLPQEQRFNDFFALWTRKETLVKARGEGLAALKDLVLLNTRGGREQVITLQESSGKSSRWFLKDLQAAYGYAAAVCVEGGSVRFSYWRLP